MISFPIIISIQKQQKKHTVSSRSFLPFFLFIVIVVLKWAFSHRLELCVSTKRKNEWHWKRKSWQNASQSTQYQRKALFVKHYSLFVVGRLHSMFILFRFSSIFFRFCIFKSYRISCAVFLFRVYVSVFVFDEPRNEFCETKFESEFWMTHFFASGVREVHFKHIIFSLNWKHKISAAGSNVIIFVILYCFLVPL